MKTIALSEKVSDKISCEAYLAGLAEEEEGFRQLFRQTFFRAMQEQLTPRQYEVLWAHAVEGLSGKEIAYRLGISQSAVSRHLTRGKKRLRVLLSYNLDLRHEQFS